MIEFIIYGSDGTGQFYPKHRGMVATCIQAEIDAYVRRYPKVIHVAIDMALPLLTDAQRYPDGRFG